MGKYINTNSNCDIMGASYNEKIRTLLDDGGVVVGKGNNMEFMDDLVCVVDNGFFSAAGYAFDEEEFVAFTFDEDTRPKTWIKYPYARCK